MSDWIELGNFIIRRSEVVFAMKRKECSNSGFFGTKITKTYSVLVKSVRNDSCILSFRNKEERNNWFSEFLIKLKNPPVADQEA